MSRTGKLNDASTWRAADIETQGLQSAYDKRCLIHCLTLYTDDEAHVLTERVDIQSAIDQYTLCFVNAKFDVASLRTHGYHIVNYHDIAVANYTLCGHRSSSFNSLEGMAQHYLQRGKLSKPASWQVFTDEMADYAREDVTLTHELIDFVLLTLQESNAHWNYYINVDLAYVESLIEMYVRGTYVDVNELKPLVPTYEANIEDIVKQHTALHGYKRGLADVVKGDTWTTVGGMPMKRELITNELGKSVMLHRRAKCDIVPYSLRGGDRQLILTERYPHLANVMPRTANGSIKTDRATLQSIEPHCPTASLWLDYETRTKQLSTFLLPLIDLSSRDANVRCSLHNYNTRTGRLSCSEPNLQQVPARGERGAEVRRAFVAPPGYSVLVGDLDRIELVVLGYYLSALLNHNVLIDRLKLGDVHAQNSEAWGCDRDGAKRGVFCIVYGGAATRLANVLKCDVVTASRILSAINNDLSLESYRAYFVEQALRNDGYITNYFGGKLYIPELLDGSKSVHASGRRKAGNYPIQSTAGAVFKLMQNRAYQLRVKLGYVNERAYQALVVHDEVIYIVRNDIVDDFINDIQPCFNSADIFPGVSVSLTFGVGANWYAAKENGEVRAKEAQRK
jgi:DNA polymerase I-like protein with 3'-5' exonuclease and polymerase domains